MTMDENVFFRQATLRICGSLDMETAMRRSLEYLRGVMPADHLILGLYDSGLGAIRILFSVSELAEGLGAPLSLYRLMREE